MDDHALSNPIVIEFNKFLPDFNSSFILSDIKIFASTAKPIESINAAAPDNVRVTGRILNIATKNVKYITKVTEAIKPGIL